MATDKVRAAARRIGGLHQRFAEFFGRKEAKAHSIVYLRGLMLAEGRKNVEAMALQFAESSNDGCVGQNEVLTLQKFLTEFSLGLRRRATGNSSCVCRGIRAVRCRVADRRGGCV